MACTPSSSALQAPGGFRRDLKNFFTFYLFEDFFSENDGLF